MFEYKTDIPAEVLPAIKAALEPLAWLIPPWCQGCYVRYTDDVRDESLKAGAAIEAVCDYTYRRFSLTFFPGFISEPVEARPAMCLHDMLHVMTGILADYAVQEIERLLPAEEAPKYRAAVIQELSVRHEAMTQDLCFVLGKHLKALQATKEQA